MVRPFFSSTPQARPRAWQRAAWVLVGGSLWVVSLGAAVEPARLAALEPIRRLIEVGPDPARAEIATQRAGAEQRGDWVLRLALDEVECRLLTDIDSRIALVIANQGIAAAETASAAVRPDLQLALLRLRACRAGIVMDLVDDKAGAAELEAVLAEAARSPALASAQAMALLERGLRRSRRGDLTQGQVDLLWACGTFVRLDLRDDEDLCLTHLAGHQRRVGDFDDALKTLGRLLDSARRRGSLLDEAIHLYGFGQVHAGRGDWDAALSHYSAALVLELRRGDDFGIAYAEYGIGQSLLKLGRPREALDNVRHALRRLSAEQDPTQHLRISMVEAGALAALDRAAEAAEILRRIEPGVRAQADDFLLAIWLETQAMAQAALGRWREAYEAMVSERAVQARVQRQQLSQQSARLRQQFNREGDEQAIRALEAANAQGQRLRQAQAAALSLFVLVLLGTLAYAVNKFREARRMRTLALNDELTQLPNRRAILASAGLLIQRGRLAVLMIDADHFKAINDVHGHAIGDQVLVRLAARLPAGLRAHDRLGRIGGEEFLALLPEASLEQAVAVAERIRHAVAAVALETDAGPVRMTVSIGVAALMSGPLPLAELIERADAALYRAKAQGRNRVVAAEDEGPAPLATSG